METKKWYMSKTLWVNGLMGIGVLVQAVTGTDLLGPEVQASAIVLINMILRVVTKSALA